VKTTLLHLRSITMAVIGYTLWVVSDAGIKLVVESKLPPYEVVAFLGLFAALSIAIFYGGQGKVRELWPKKPMNQIIRSLLAFGCVTCNAIALKHLPLTVFYVVVFTSPMIVALLASCTLREHLSWSKIIAIVVGFVGVVIAIDPWDHLSGGDWIGYAAATGSAVFYSFATTMLRFTSQSETTHSIIFMTGMVEVILGFGLMFWHAVPVPLSVLMIMALMGAVCGSGSIFNANALKHTDAATVEQFHYTQIIFGALIGYAIWHEVPTHNTVFGAIVIVVSGIYIAAVAHQADKNAIALQV